jgi:hypothetical protein
MYPENGCPMRTILIPSLLIAFTTITLAYDPPKPVKPVKPVFTMSRETTFITEPLDKDGYPDYETALNKHLKGTIKPEANACVRLWDAWGPTPEGGKPLHADYWKWLGREVPPEKGEYFIDAFKFFKAAGRDEFNDSDFDQHSQLSKAPWSEAAYRDYAAWLEAIEKPLAVTIEAVKRPHYYSPMTSRTRDNKPGMLLGVLLPHVQKAREIGDALVKRAMLRVGQEKYSEAWADIQACHRLGRHMAHGGTLIELLVGIALDAIACRADIAFLEHSKLDAKQIGQCLKDRSSLPPMPTALEKMKWAERFVMLDAVCHLRRNGIELLQSLTESGEIGIKDEALNKAFEQMDWNVTFRVCTKWYDRTIEIMSESDRTKRSEMAAKMFNDLGQMKVNAMQEKNVIGKAIETGKVDYFVAKQIGQVVVSLMLPASEKVTFAYERSLQTLDNTRLAFALAAYHVDHKKYPNSLGDLAPKYLPTIPGDIFSGKALIYKLTDTGYVFYSVGTNEKDDGGRLLTDEYQAGESRGDDIGVRMPALKK